MDYNKANCNLITGGKETGKSALCEALATHYSEQDPNSKILDLWGCYDIDTEVYTEEGWKFFKDVTFLDKIVTLNYEKNRLELANPTAIQTYDYEGSMISFGGKNSRYDLLVTPDHNMFIRELHYRYSDLKFLKASQILAFAKVHSRCLPFALVRKAPWKYRNIEWFELQSDCKAPALKKVRMEYWLRFFAWYISEGSLHRIANNKEKNWYQYRVEICQKSSKEKCEEIKEAFIRIGLAPKQDHDKIYVNSKVLYDYLKQFGKAETKYLPKWLKHLPRTKLNFYIETALKGDGHERVYYTSSKQLADDFQEICLRAGYNASIGLHATRKKYGTIRGRQIKSSFPAYSISINKDNRDTHILGTQIETVQYRGKIYDVTVPNHTLFVRRHGKVCWSGNSRDNEGIAWCRSPYKDQVLLLVGDSVKVKSRFPSVKVSDFKLSSMKGHKVLVSVSGFYSSDREQNRAVQTVMTELWRRSGWSHIWCLILREMANLIYARLSIGEDQAQAKAYMIFVLREMRHMGFALCGDSIKFKSVDSDLRALADYTYIKACGKEGLPSDLEWLYSIFEPFSVMRMPVDQFIIVSRRGTVGRGFFACPPWHKKENENIFKLLNIDIEHTDEPDLDTRGGRINDREHVDIIKKRFAGPNGKVLSFTKLAVKCERSTSTVYNAVLYHNQEVAERGFCDRCKRLEGPLASVKV